MRACRKRSSSLKRACRKDKRRKLRYFRYYNDEDLSFGSHEQVLRIWIPRSQVGDSLEMCPQDESFIIANDATVKDMEGADVAYVADLLKVPGFYKYVTDIIDGDKPTTEEFLENLAAVAAALEQAVAQVIDYINGKCNTEL
ncbi:5'-methylthioadenosine/S-adenosylhomocysteine nucleosidase 2 [Heracleum sosnowskyi]|uniref:5'-methylthioadenosine/S-adenosylhomocysteine nucleosidase 2 n=1 Tax=Heracleum sosnowskyi TaxID=360622 RepID=A0AAD8I8K1_9APIA|nr:5'-methylthioadenosine/S-adenosylhomocysteine nucleosidase 2 [Heracleum sosnowskyi]